MKLSTALGALNKGAWSGATAYIVADIVTSGGSSYICILAHTNHTPPNGTYWVVLAAAGSNGSNGSTGATGAPGPGVPTGGSTGDFLKKNSGTDFDTVWSSAPGGGGIGMFYTCESNGTVNTTTTIFGGPGSVSLSSTENQRQTIIPKSGTLSKFYIQTNAIQGNNTLVVTLRLNGVDTALVVTVPATSAAGVYSDLTHTVSATAGQLIGWKFTNNANDSQQNMGGISVLFE